MASAPEESLKNKPVYSHALVAWKDDAEGTSGFEVIDFFITQAEADTKAKEMAATEGKRFVVFEATKVFGSITKIELLYTRRG